MSEMHDGWGIYHALAWAIVAVLFAVCGVAVDVYKKLNGRQ